MSKSNVAQTILANSTDLIARITAAENAAVETNQDWDIGATTFSFGDGSALRFEGPSVDICPSETGYNVYKFSGEDDSEQEFIGSTATSSDALNLIPASARHTGGGYQIQRGLDGDVETI